MPPEGGDASAGTSPAPAAAAAAREYAAAAAAGTPGPASADAAEAERQQRAAPGISPTHMHTRGYAAARKDSQTTKIKITDLR